MAHGTGYYWNLIHKATLKTEEYAVTFTRLYYYWYPEMSDCYEPSCEARDEYEVTVTRWRDDPHRRGSRIADHCCEGCRTGSISKDEANKIWWNIKNHNISYAECKRYFTELAGRLISA